MNIMTFLLLIIMIIKKFKKNHKTIIINQIKNEFYLHFENYSKINEI